MKKFLIFVLCALFILKANAQINEIRELLYTNLGAEGNKEYYSGQYLKGKRNGLGFLKAKDNTIYLGDFSNNSITGVGVYITAKNNEIKNCKDAVIFVGKLEKQLKKGKGRCYDANGKLIYDGRFENDIPVETYPSTSVDNQRFVIGQLTNGIQFIGESSDNLINGIALFIDTNGDKYFGTYRKNQQKGYSIHVLNNGEWETFYTEKGETKNISSSARYQSLAANRSETNQQAFSTFLNGVTDVIADICSAQNKANTSSFISVEVVNETNSSSYNKVNPKEGGRKNDKRGSINKKNTKVESKKKDELCSDCLGTGNCNSNSIGVLSKNYCQGTKKCGWCGGNGYLSGNINSKKACPNCEKPGSEHYSNGVLKVTPGNGICAQCGGSGICKTCNGKKRIARN